MWIRLLGVKVSKIHRIRGGDPARVGSLWTHCGLGCACKGAAGGVCWTGCLPAFSPLSDRGKGPEKVMVDFWESAPSKQIENEDD